MEAYAGTYYVRIGVIATAQSAGNVFWDDIICRRRKKGNLIVDGTITADHLATGTLSADNIEAGNINTGLITVGSVLQLDPDGKIYTAGKTSATDTDKGFFIGYDGSGDYDFGIGQGTTESLVWDGSEGTLTVYGDIIDTPNLTTSASAERGTDFDTGHQSSSANYESTDAAYTTADPCDADVALIFCEGTFNMAGSGTGQMRVAMYNVDTTTTTYPVISGEASVNGQVIYANNAAVLTSSNQYTFTIQVYHTDWTSQVSDWSDLRLNVVTIKR